MTVETNDKTTNPADTNPTGEDIPVVIVGDEAPPATIPPSAPSQPATETAKPSTPPSPTKPDPKTETDGEEDDGKFHIQVTLEQINEGCPNCGLYFAVPADFIRKRRKDGKSFSCPNGHVMSFDKPADPKIKTERERALEKQLGEVTEACRVKVERAQTQQTLAEQRWEEAIRRVLDLRAWVEKPMHLKNCERGVFQMSCTCGRKDLLSQSEMPYPSKVTTTADNHIKKG